jgi:hypothetical protein
MSGLTASLPRSPSLPQADPRTSGSSSESRVMSSLTDSSGRGRRIGASGFMVTMCQ